MATLGLILLGIGVIVGLVGGIWILMLAFQESIVWGIGCIFVPFVSLIFVVMNWDEAKKPFLINLGGLALMILGSALGGGGMEGA